MTPGEASQTPKQREHQAARRGGGWIRREHVIEQPAGRLAKRAREAVVVEPEADLPQGAGVVA